tara:strand:+ start:232 stop:468 length:237 start_codon:yes stop_codon:yes gene_type:complete
METPTPTISKQGIANQRYRNKNRAKYNDYMREYQKNRYKNDPVAKERLRTQQRKYVARKRTEKLAEKSDDEEIVLKPQ